MGVETFLLHCIAFLALYAKKVVSVAVPLFEPSVGNITLEHFSFVIDEVDGT